MMSIVSDKTSTKTHAKSMLSNMVHVSVLKMIERHVIGVVKRFPHEQLETGPDSRFRGSKDETPVAYLCLQQVRRTENPCFQMVSSVTGNPWTGRGLQAKLSKNSFLNNEGSSTSLVEQKTKTTNFSNLEI